MTCLVCLYHVAVQMPQRAIIFFRVSFGFPTAESWLSLDVFTAKSAFSSLSLNVSNSFNSLSIESIGQSLVWAVPPLHHEAIWNHFEDTRTRYKQRPSAWLADWTVIWYISCDMSRNLDQTTSLRFPTWWGPIKVGLPTSFLAFKRYSMVRLCPPKPFDVDASAMHLLW